MMNCFCGMIEQQIELNSLSSRDNYQRFSSLQTYNTPQEGLEPEQNHENHENKFILLMITDCEK